MTRLSSLVACVGLSESRGNPQGVEGLTGARRRIWAGVSLFLVALVGVVACWPAQAAGQTGPAQEVARLMASMDVAARGPSGPADLSVSFAGTGLVDRRAWNDVDADGVADVVEDAMCGSATCAQPWEDVDEDGIADWVEELACGDDLCAEGSLDSDGDGIPDFVGWILCGETGCSAETLFGDVDGDGIANWIEAVILGDATSATGAEDFNSNGASDAAELARCLEKLEAEDADLAETGVDVGLWLFVALGLVGLGLASQGAGRFRSNSRGEGAGL